MDSLLEAALAYADRGFSVIRISPGEKRPPGKWKQYQTKRATAEQLHVWFGAGGYGVGIICGSVSGDLAVVDFDDPAAFADWKQRNPDLADACPIVRTGRGFHVYLRCWTSSGKFSGGELQAEGKLVVAPPSQHPSGKQYVWVRAPNGRLRVVQDRTDLGLPGLRCGGPTKIDKSKPADSDTPPRPMSCVSWLTREVRDRALADIRRAVAASLPNHPGKRHDLLFDYLRRLRGLPWGDKIKLQHLRPLVLEWFGKAKPFVGTKDFELTYLDALEGWAEITSPRGVVLRDALRRAQALPDSQIPAAVRDIGDRTVPTAKLCLMLSRDSEEGCFEELDPEATNGAFFLACEALGDLLDVSGRTGNKILRALCSLQFLRIKRKGRRGEGATIYELGPLAARGPPG